MAEQVTLKSFLDNDAAVKAARKKLTAASAELNKQKSALSAAGNRATPELRAQIERRIQVAQDAYNKARSEASSIETRQTAYFNTNKTKIQAAADTKDINQAKQELQDVLSLRSSMGANDVLDARIQDLNERINQTGKYAPKPTAAETKDTTPGDQKTVTEPRNYLKEIDNAAKLINSMSPQERQDLSSLLKAAGYNVTVTNVYNDQLVSEYQRALAANQTRSAALSQEISWSQFLQDKINETNVLKGAAGGAAVPTGSVSISTATEAASKVEDVFQSVLKRLPTAQEVKDFTKLLNAEEKKASSITKGTVKTIGGVKYTEYTGGIDRIQFLSDLVRNKYAKEIEETGLVQKDVAQRVKDKEAYDKAITAAKGDETKIKKLNETTSYGLAITGLKNRIKAAADKAGATYDDAQVDSWAREAYDTNQDADIASLQNFLNSKFKFGENGFRGVAADNYNALNKIAIANGLDLNKVFGSKISTWLEDLNKGANIEDYKKAIRDVAKIGMPEKITKLIDQGFDLQTIYSPYQSLMENVLEVPRGSITLDDPVLRSAITAEGEVPLYQFERDLRKDNRWQFTKQAKQEVSSAVLGILRDFGFQG